MRFGFCADRRGLPRWRCCRWRWELARMRRCLRWRTSCCSVRQRMSQMLVSCTNSIFGETKKARFSGDFTTSPGSPNTSRSSSTRHRSLQSPCTRRRAKCDWGAGPASRASRNQWFPPTISKPLVSSHYEEDSCCPRMKLKRTHHTRSSFRMVSGNVNLLALIVRWALTTMPTILHLS